MSITKERMTMVFRYPSQPKTVRLQHVYKLQMNTQPIRTTWFVSRQTFSNPWNWNIFINTKPQMFVVWWTNGKSNPYKKEPFWEALFCFCKGDAPSSGAWHFTSVYVRLTTGMAFCARRCPPGIESGMTKAAGMTNQRFPSIFTESVGTSNY